LRGWAALTALFLGSERGVAFGAALRVEDAGFAAFRVAAGRVVVCRAAGFGAAARLVALRAGLAVLRAVALGLAAFRAVFFGAAFRLETVLRVAALRAAGLRAVA
jgi:hypothetical protein